MHTALLLQLLSAVAASGAGGLQDLSNYLEYSPQFSSAGQPTAAQLETLRDAGFERIIYIAFSDHENALPNEDRLVEALGMQYLHIPVDWSAPTRSDFYLVAAALEQAPEARTLLHCQVNYRASAFSFLYRVIYQGVPVEEARRQMESVWLPNETWLDLIAEVLQEHDMNKGENR